MKCPYCNGEMQTGMVKVSGSLPFSYQVSWFPASEEKKLLKDPLVSLEHAAEGYYCDSCHKVVAVFEPE